MNVSCLHSFQFFISIFFLFDFCFPDTLLKFNIHIVSVVQVLDMVQHWEVIYVCNL